jgi:hypothetical protein
MFLRKHSRLLPKQLQLTGLYNTDTFFLQFQTSAFKQFIRYITRALSPFYIHRDKVSITREFDFLALNGESIKITPQNETRKFPLNTFLFNFLDIQGVPLATEPGISLIILTPMKILQRNLNSSTFVV